jgi:hypothetical protein
MKYLLSILIIGLLVYATGCKKSSNNSVSGGGKGGNSTLIIIPEHGGVLIDSCTVYIKYGATDAPANGVYDDSTTCVLNDTIPQAVFRNLTNGVYYMYGKGYHATYSPPYLKGSANPTINGQDTVQAYLQLGSYTSW